MLHRQENNILGLVFGVDLARPALKLPFIVKDKEFFD
jgi:hypothetical protein